MAVPYPPIRHGPGRRTPGSGVPVRSSRPSIVHPALPPYRLTALLLAAVAAGPAPALAQYPDTYTVPAGALRFSFEPEFNAWDTRFGPEGEDEPLGLDLSPDVAGPNFFPTLLAPLLAVRSIIADPGYQLNMGALRTALDADIRRFPFNFALGITDRITLTASIPVVTTRAQVALTLDTTDANVGWNQAAGASGNPGGLAAIAMLLGELEAAATALDAQIAAGDFGCPTSAMCDEARDLVTRTRSLRMDLVALTGVGQSEGAPLPPFAPTQASAAGVALRAAIDSIAQELASFGATVTGSLALPEQRLAVEDINTVLTQEEFGYDAFGLEFAKLRNSLGDLELGLRFGLLQTAGVRAVLSGTVRLPTGKLDDPGHVVDLGSGDHQMDVVGGLELALEPGSAVGISLFGRYTLQLPHTLERRVAPPDRPIALAALQAPVRRDLGDVLEAGVYPTVRLSQAFRAYLSAYYRRQFEDRYSLPSGVTLPTSAPGAVPVAALAQESAMEAISLGGGVYYRSVTDRRGLTLPIEAGIDYRTAWDGSGGLTPKPTRVNFYLRLYYRLWGRRAGGQTGEATQPVTN